MSNQSAYPVLENRERTGEEGVTSAGRREHGPRQRTFRIDWLVALMVLAALPLGALSKQSVPSCEGKDELEKALASHPLVSGTEILAFSHRSGKWSLCTWNGFELQGSSVEVEPQIDDQPRLLLGKDTELAIFLVDTNAMLYRAKPGESKEKDSENAADLQKLIGLLGGVTVAELEVLGRRRADAATSGFEVKGFEAVTGQAATEAAEVVHVEADADLVKLRAELEKAVEALASRSRGLAAAAAKAKASAEWLAISQAEVRAWIQDQERSALPGDPPDVLRVGGGKARSDFAALRAQVGTAEELDVPCRDRLEVAARALALRNCLASPQGGLCGGTADGLQSLLVSLDHPLQSGELCSAELHDAIASVGARVRWSGSSGPPKLVDADLFEAVSTSIAAVLELGKKSVLAREAAAKAIDGEAEVQNAAAALDATAARYSLLCPGPDPKSCSLRVVELERRIGHRTDLKWNKFRTESFSVVRDPQLKDVVSSLSADARFEYELARVETEKRRFALDYALLYTEVADSTFTAVAQDPKDPNNKTKRIGVKDRDTRAGEPVLFLTWADARSGEWATGPQFGVAVDSSKPGVYLGWSLRWRFLGLGAGFGAHRLTTLDGQMLGAEVSGNDDIKTRKEFETSLSSWYVALTVSLNDLPLFRPKG